MKRRIWIFFGIFVLLLSGSISYANDIILEVLRSKEGLSYIPTNKQFNGTTFSFSLANESTYMGVRYNRGIENNPSEVERLTKNYADIEFEKSIKNFVLATMLDYRYEKNILTVFEQTETIMLETQRRGDLAIGLGFKFGNYNKSFVSVVGICGISFAAGEDDLKFIDIKLKSKSTDVVTGTNITGRLETNIVLPLWFDFRGKYNYYLKSQDHKIESTVGMGIKIIEFLGIKGSITTAKITGQRIKIVHYGLGLVLIF